MQAKGSADLNFSVAVRTPVDYQATANEVKDADVIISSEVFLPPRRRRNAS